MEGVDAGIEREEVGQHGTEEIELPFAAKGGLANGEHRLEPSHRHAAYQPIHRCGLDLLNPRQPFARCLFRLFVMQRRKVVGAQHLHQRIAPQQRDIVERQVGNQGPVQAAIESRTQRPGRPDQVAEGGKRGGAAGRHADAADLEAGSAGAVGTGERHRDGFVQIDRSGLVPAHEREAVLKAIATHRLLDPHPVVERQPLFGPLNLVLETFKRLIDARGAARAPQIALDPPLDLVDREDFETVGMAIARLEGILRLTAIEIDRLAVVLEQVDGGHAVEHERVGTDLELRRQRPVEAEMDLELADRQRLLWPLAARELEEEETFRKAEVLLQDPVTGIDIVRIGQQRIITLEADRFQCLGLLTEPLAVDLQLDMGELVGEPEIEFIGGVAIAAKKETQLIELQLAQGKRCMQGDIQRDGGEIVATLRRDMLDVCGIDPGIVTGLEVAGHAILRQAVELASLTHQRRLGDGPRNDRKLHDGHAGYGTQVVGPEHIEQTVGQLGKLILNLGAQVAREKGEPFQQALHVRIAILLRQKAGEFGIGSGKFAPLQAQKSQFIPEVMFQRH